MKGRGLSIALLASALLSVGCSAGGPETIGPDGTAVPIVDGTRETGEPAVVFIALGGEFGGACTGTLITERVVLTAKHCVQFGTSQRPAPASFFQVGVGDRRGNVEYHPVRSVVTTPGAFWIGGGSDIALLILREPITGVEPIPVRRDPPTDLGGREATAIGFGTTREREVGTKYRVTTTITGVSDYVVEARNTICQGDSGGPLILESDGTRPREVIGVASYGRALTEGSCPAEMGDAWNRVDTYIHLVDLAILQSGDCVPRGEETCNSLDDNCDGTIDEGCAELGASCESDDDCAYGPLPEGWAELASTPVVCAEAGDARRCTIACNVLEPSTSCGALSPPFGDDLPIEGFHCAAGGGGCEGFCAPGGPGDKAPGEACAAHTECASLRCEAGSCATPCRGGAGACPAAEACGADAGACGVCVAPEQRPTNRAPGELCSAPEECSSLGCGPVDGVSQCTRECATDRGCGAGLRCVGGFCARGERSRNFEPCASDDDCDEGLCLEEDGQWFCARSCGPSTCPGGTCTDLGGGDMRCLPNGAVLGAACDDTASCAIGECIDGTCTATCGGESACPLGYDCVREGSRVVCRPRPAASGGGCAVGGRGGAGGVWLLAVGALVAVRRRRALV